MIVFIICLIVGIALIVLTAKGLSSNNTMTYIIGILFIIIGILALLFDRDFFVGKAQISIGLFMFSYSLAGVFLIAIIKNMSFIFHAKTKIKGVFVGKNAKRSGLFSYYTLSFSYEYNKSKYTQTTTEIVDGLTAARLKEGNEYTIYISSKNPRNMVYRRYPSAGTRWMIIMFIALILIPIGYVTGFY